MSRQLGIILVLGTLLLTAAGCAKLMHLEQLLTLKGYGENADKQHAYVNGANARFEELIQAVKNDELKQYPHQKDIVKAFGDPIYTRPYDYQGKVYDRCLYRYQERFMNSEKVYFYFDKEGLWQHYEHLLPKTKTAADQ